MSVRNRKPRKNRKMIGNREPPQVEASIVASGVFRYVAASEITDSAITRENLLDSLIMNTNSGTANRRIFEAIKISRVELWTVSTGQLEIEWESTNAPNKCAINRSLNQFSTGHIISYPPKDSRASMWSKTGSADESQVLFRILATVGSVIDLHYTAVIGSKNTSTLVTTTNNGTVGEVYRVYLGGPTTTEWKPSGFNTII